jgi:hypothetical protein
VEHSWTTFHAELEKVGKFHEQLASKAEELVLTLDNWVKEKEKTKIKVGHTETPPTRNLAPRDLVLKLPLSLSLRVCVCVCAV